MSDSQPSKPVGQPGGISSQTEGNNLWELEAEDGVVPQPIDDPATDESGSMMDWRSLPKRENRRKSIVHLDIQATGHAMGDGSKSMPERRMEMEFGSLDDRVDLTEAEGVPAPADAGFAVAGEHAHSGVDPFGDASDEGTTGAPEPVNEGVPEGLTQAGANMVTDDKPARPPIGMVEWVALGLLGVLLVGLSVGAYFWSIRLLPEETPRWKSVDFPVKGAGIEIKHAVTYWREPVLEGPNKDSVRRGVRLIPIVEMDLSGGPVALRVIFRDDEGRSMGDPIFRAVSSSGKLALASTAGFDDPGMHAAYRTEDLEPWTVEISEASSLDAPGSAYAQILKMNISPELR